MNGAGVRLTFNFRTNFNVGRSGGNFILGFRLRLVTLNLSNLACYGEIRLLGLWFCFEFVRHGSMFNLVHKWTPP